MSETGQEATSPSQQIGALFDHFVGELLKLQRHINPDCICGLQIYYEIEFDRLFDW
jgi:hypothetical protein